MKQNFTQRISFDGKIVLAVIIPEHRQDGMYYEVNVKNYPRFYMTMSPLGRYDLVPEPGINIPYDLILAVSDAIEESSRR